VTSTAPPTIAEVKRALRSEMIAARARLSREERAVRSRAIADRAWSLPALCEARILATYAPLGTEVDALEIARRALPRGAEVVFPRAVPGQRRLEFARCDPAALVPGPFGNVEPPADAPAVDPARIDCVVLPGLAFSEDGLRLGRGGGHYDATLHAMPRAHRIGVAFEVQVVPAVPREPHDAFLDALVTEARVLELVRDLR
jgi:5-formyltetrahydrofolate cyclo-ligase